MIFVKFIAILLTTAAGLLQISLEHKWHDKRTKQQKKIRSLLIILMIVGFITASSLVIYDDQQTEKQIQGLTELNNSAEKAAKDAERRESKAIEDREQIKKELGELQEKIKPVVELATEKYPSLDVKNALVKLTDELQDLQKQSEELQRQTKTLSVRDYFHSLKPDTKNIVIERLKQVRGSLRDRKIEIQIISETGNTNRQKVAKELVEILKECNFRTSGPTPTMTFSKGVLSPVVISINPTEEDIARKLAYALNPFLNVEFSGKVQNSYDPGKITIAIYGNPMFNENGSVTFP